MSDDRQNSPDTTTLALGRLARSSAHDFELNPDAETRTKAAEALGIDAVRKLRFVGTLAPIGRTDWTLSARLGATVVQPCVVTLQPVTTRIDVDVTRHYLADVEIPDVEEAEIPEDDTVEALPDRLDLWTLLLEALALALPDYPRAEGAELETRHFAAPGVAPMSDEDARPLAGLAALRDALAGSDSDQPDAGDDAETTRDGPADNGREGGRE